MVSSIGNDSDVSRVQTQSVDSTVQVEKARKQAKLDTASVALPGSRFVGHSDENMDLAQPNAPFNITDAKKVLSVMSKKEASGEHLDYMAIMVLLAKIAQKEQQMSRDRSIQDIEAVEAQQHEAANDLRTGASLALAGAVLSGAATITGGALSIVGGAHTMVSLKLPAPSGELVAARSEAKELGITPEEVAGESDIGGGESEAVTPKLEETVTGRSESKIAAESREDVQADVQENLIDLQDSVSKTQEDSSVYGEEGGLNTETTSAGNSESISEVEEKGQSLQPQDSLEEVEEKGQSLQPQDSLEDDAVPVGKEDGVVARSEDQKQTEDESGVTKIGEEGEKDARAQQVKKRRVVRELRKLEKEYADQAQSAGFLGTQKAQALNLAYSGGSQVFQGIGQLVGGALQSGSQYMQADSKDKDAAAEWFRAHLQKENDFGQGQKQYVDGAFQTIQQLYDGKHDVTKNIMQTI